MTTTFAAPAVQPIYFSNPKKYLVMKSNDGPNCEYLRTPDAHILEINKENIAFLKEFLDNVAPLLGSMKKHGFCKVFLSNYIGDWVCVQEDYEEQWKLFWKDIEGTAQIVDELPDFLIEAHEYDVSIENQILSCDNPSQIIFEAHLYDGSVEVFTDDVDIDFIVNAIGYKPNQEDIAEYIADPTHCPICGEENIWTNDGDFTVSEDGQIAASKTVCKSCGASWEDNYRICGYQNLVKGD